MYLKILKAFSVAKETVITDIPCEISTPPSCPGNNIRESDAIFDKFVVVVSIKLFWNQSRQEQAFP